MKNQPLHFCLYIGLNSLLDKGSCCNVNRQQSSVNFFRLLIMLLVLAAGLCGAKETHAEADRLFFAEVKGSISIIRSIPARTAGQKERKVKRIENWIARCLVTEQLGNTNKNIFCLYGKGTDFKPAARDDTDGSPLIATLRAYNIIKIKKWKEEYRLFTDAVRILTENFHTIRTEDMPSSFKNYVFGTKVLHEFTDAGIKNLDSFAVATHVFLQKHPDQEKAEELKGKLALSIERSKRLEAEKEKVEAAYRTYRKTHPENPPKIEELNLKISRLNDSIRNLNTKNSTLRKGNDYLEEKIAKLNKKNPEGSAWVELDEIRNEHASAIEKQKELTKEKAQELAKVEKDNKYVMAIAAAIAFLVGIALAMFFLLVTTPKKIRGYMREKNDYVIKTFGDMFLRLDKLARELKQPSMQIRPETAPPMLVSEQNRLGEIITGKAVSDFSALVRSAEAAQFQLAALSGADRNAPISEICSVLEAAQSTLAKLLSLYSYQPSPSRISFESDVFSASSPSLEKGIVQIEEQLKKRIQDNSELKESSKQLLLFLGVEKRQVARSSAIGISDINSHITQLEEEIDAVFYELFGYKGVRNYGVRYTLSELRNELVGIAPARGSSVLKQIEEISRIKNLTISTFNIRGMDENSIREEINQVKSNSDIGFDFLSALEEPERRRLLSRDDTKTTAQKIQAITTGHRRFSAINKQWKNYGENDLSSESFGDLLKNVNELIDESLPKNKKKEGVVENLPLVLARYKDNSERLMQCLDKQKNDRAWAETYEMFLSKHHRQPLPGFPTADKLEGWLVQFENKQTTWAWLHPVLLGELRACTNLVDALREKGDFALNNCLDALGMSDITEDYTASPGSGALFAKSYEENEALHEDKNLYNALTKKSHKIFRANALLETYFADNNKLQGLSLHLSLLSKTLHTVFNGLGVQINEPGLLKAIPKEATTVGEGEHFPKLKAIPEVRQKVGARAGKDTEFVVDINYYEIEGFGRKIEMEVVIYTTVAWT